MFCLDQMNRTSAKRKIFSYDNATPPINPSILITKMKIIKLFGLTAENRRSIISNKKRLTWRFGFSQARAISSCGVELQGC